MVGKLENATDGASALAAGLEQLLAPVVTECDQQVETVLASQNVLSENIDRVTQILAKLLESTPEPVVSSQASKLSDIRRRITGLSNNVYGLQERLQKLHALRARLPVPLSATGEPLAQEKEGEQEPGSMPEEAAGDSAGGREQSSK